MVAQWLRLAYRNGQNWTDTPHFFFSPPKGGNRSSFHNIVFRSGCQVTDKIQKHININKLWLKFANCMGRKQEIAYVHYLALLHTWLGLLRRKNLFHLAFYQLLFADTHMRIFWMQCMSAIHQETLARWLVDVDCCLNNLTIVTRIVLVSLQPKSLWEILNLYFSFNLSVAVWKCSRQFSLSIMWRFWITWFFCLLLSIEDLAWEEIILG